MGINYPDGDNDGIDVFDIPSNPQVTTLSSAGTGHRNIPESVQDLGLAVMAIEANVSRMAHDHNGAGGTRHGSKLSQANTHESADTDASPGSIHHTLDTPTGRTANKAAPANHTHDYATTQILNKPFVICTSTTRPGSPLLGELIFETDTNFHRVWTTIGGTLAWHIAPLLTKPVCRLEQGDSQPLAAGGTILEWHTEIEDNNNFFTPGASLTDVTIQDAGLYHIDTAAQWNTNRAPDTCYVVVTVNSAETTLRDHKFQKGEDFFPGFSQTIHTSGKLRLNQGDVIRVKVGFSASQGLFGLIFSFFEFITGQAPYSKITSRLELTYETA